MPFYLKIMLGLFVSLSLFAEFSITQIEQPSVHINNLFNTAPPERALKLEKVVVKDTTPSTELSNEDDEIEFAVELPELADNNAPVRIDGALLNYPNPFSYSRNETHIGYRLTKAADVTLSIYSLTGYKIYSALLEKETEGGSGRYNRVLINQFVLGGTYLAPGVYLYLITHDGKLLGKNRMVVIP